MATSSLRANAAPPPATATSRDARDAADAPTWSVPRWPPPLPAPDILWIFASGKRERGQHGTIYHTHRQGPAAGPHQRQYRRDHARALSENDQAQRLRGRALRELALYRSAGHAARPDLRAEPATLSGRDDPAGRG